MCCALHGGSKPHNPRAFRHGLAHLQRSAGSRASRAAGGRLSQKRRRSSRTRASRTFGCLPRRTRSRGKVRGPAARRAAVDAPRRAHMAHTHRRRGGQERTHAITEQHVAVWHLHPPHCDLRTAPTAALHARLPAVSALQFQLALRQPGAATGVHLCAKGGWRCARGGLRVQPPLW